MGAGFSPVGVGSAEGVVAPGASGVGAAATTAGSSCRLVVADEVVPTAGGAAVGVGGDVELAISAS
jgi:hypothetical protein